MKEEKPKDIYAEADEKWHQVMVKVGRAESQRFATNPESYTDILITAESVRLLMRWIYHHMVSRKKIKPIEQYSQEERQEIWDLVLEKCKAKCQDKQKLIEVAKVFCLIEYFLNENNGTPNRKI